MLSESASSNGKGVQEETRSERGTLMEEEKGNEIEGREVKEIIRMDEMDKALIGLSGIKEDQILEEWGTTSLLQAIEDIGALESCVPLLDKKKGLQVRRSIDYMKTFLTVYESTPTAFLPKSFKKSKDAPIGKSEFERWFRDNLKSNFVGQCVKMGDIERIISDCGWEILEIKSVIESNGIMMVGEWKLETSTGRLFSCFGELLDGDLNAIFHVPIEMVPAVIKAIGANPDAKEETDGTD
jgi:hypothetical protein